MPNTPSSDPSQGAQPSPSQTLLELAGQLERDEKPEMEDLKAALGSFRVAGLDKSVQQMAIEAREDVRHGRYPDAFLLRMLAKGLTGELPGRRRGRPLGSTNKPKAATDDATATAAPVVAAVPEVNEGMNRAVAAAHAPRGGRTKVEFDEPEPEPLEFGDEDDHLLTPADLTGLVSAAEIDFNKVGVSLREQTDRAIDGLTDKEREVLRTRFLVPDEGTIHVKKGDQIRIVATPSNGYGVVVEPIDTNERSPSEWVALAADVIEHLEMPTHAELCGELYALAERLEIAPPVDPDEMSLLERTEKEIERRVRRAIESPAELPAWVIEWARAERSIRRFEEVEKQNEDARARRDAEIFGAGGVPRG